MYMILHKIFRPTVMPICIDEQSKRKYHFQTGNVLTQTLVTHWQHANYCVGVLLGCYQVYAATYSQDEIFSLKR